MNKSGGLKLRCVQLGVAMMLLGCKSAVAPLNGDIYILESISERSLPAPYSAIAESTNRIHADTIAFDVNGSGERRTLYDSYQGTMRLARATFTYNRMGGRVEIAFDCRDTEVCIAPPQLAGTITNTGLTITESKITRLPLVFRRL